VTTGTSSATERDVPVVPDHRVTYIATESADGSTYVVEIDPTQPDKK
jgi:hypothetical protein